MFHGWHARPSLIFLYTDIQSTWSFIVFAFSLVIGSSFHTQGLPWLIICCSQHFSQMEKAGAKWKKLEPIEIDFSQGFSQKVVSRSFFCI